MKTSEFTKTEKRILIFLLLVTGGLQLKYFFMEFDADTAYALSTAWRIVTGDRMFLELWEPHQTSSFVLAGIMWLYTAIVGSNTGIVLFANGVGIVLHILVVAALYRTLRNRMDRFGLSLMCIFLLAVRPKGYVLPDFSNLQMWCSLLLLVCLIRYLDGRKRILWLCLGSVCLCLQVLSYPSCLLVYGSVVVILWIYAERKWTDILLFSGCCLLQGCAYVLFFVASMGWTGFLSGLSNILRRDSAHDLTLFNPSFWASMRPALIWLGVCLLLALIAELIRNTVAYIQHKSTKLSLSLSGVTMLFAIFAMITGMINRVAFKDSFPASWVWFAAFYLIIFAAAWKGFRHCSGDEQRWVLTGTVLSVGSFLAIALLTNLDFLCTLNYLAPAVALSFIPIGHLLTGQRESVAPVKTYGVLILFCLTILFQNSADMLYMGGMVKSGPVMGWVSNYLDTYSVNTSVAEWQEYVMPGDRVLIVGKSPLNTIGYLYEDVTVSTYSVMCDPTYDETLLQYWEQYPERYPNVVIVQSWYGEIRPEEDSWIMQWLLNDWQPDDYEDGCFWRYYRKG